MKSCYLFAFHLVDVPKSILWPLNGHWLPTIGDRLLRLLRTTDGRRAGVIEPSSSVWAKVGWVLSSKITGWWNAGFIGSSSPARNRSWSRIDV